MIVQRCLRPFALATLAALALAATAPVRAWQEVPEDVRKRELPPKYTIGDVRIGFMEKFKLGYWTVINVDLKAEHKAFEGSLTIETPDSDDLNTTITIPAVAIEKDTSRTVQGLIRFGKGTPRLSVLLRDREGRTVDSLPIDFSNGDRTNPVSIGKRLWLSIGQPSGLSELIGGDGQAGPVDSGDDTDGNLAKKRFNQLNELALAVKQDDLPLNWTAYEAVAGVILATGNVGTLDRLSPAARSALDTWVRQGGHLIVSVGSNWEVVSKDAFLAPLLPAKLKGITRTNRIDALNLNLTTKLPISRDGSLDLVSLTDVRGKVMATAGEMPLVVTGTAGLGKVTLITFDTDQAPFSAWEGRREFWSVDQYGLGIRSNADTGATEMARGRFGGGDEPRGDLSLNLAQTLESFSEVTVVPFGYVAAMVFAYILLIGPIDYLLLKKVFGRLEWTWFSFPIWVAVVSAAAYYAAYHLKGSDLRINRVDVVDIDHATGTMRGLSTISIFSPRSDQYTLSMQPGALSAEPWTATGGGRDQSVSTTSWLGFPGREFRSMGNTGSISLVGRAGYEYTDSRGGGVSKAPIQIWALKNFMHRWIGKAGPTLECKFRTSEGTLVGSITNRMPHPVHDVAVIKGESVWRVARLDPGQTADLSAVNPVQLGTWLAQSSDGGELAKGDNFNPDDAVRPLMFHTSRKSNRPQENGYFQWLDQSDRLELDRVIVVAKSDQPAGELWLNPPEGQGPNTPGAKAPEIRGRMKTRTWYRLVVEPGKADE
jgi:hypothetical protein